MIGNLKGTYWKEFLKKRCAYPLVVVRGSREGLWEESQFLNVKPSCLPFEKKARPLMSIRRLREDISDVILQPHTNIVIEMF
jgi:hypothetical protein